MDIERDGNIIEAGVWFVLGVVLFFYAWRREARLRNVLRILAVTVLVFGGSDLVEAKTGAWWRPWWLFAWKALCFVVMTGAIVHYYRLTKRSAGAKPDRT